MQKNNAIAKHTKKTNTANGNIGETWLRALMKFAGHCITARALPWLLLAALLSSCAPEQVQGEVLKEEWTEYECTAWTRISSGDVVGLRFALARGGKAGFDAITLKGEQLTGKKIRCVLGPAFAVKRCTILERNGERSIRRSDDR